MREILRRHEASVEIIFAVAVFFALIYAIYMKDAVTVGTIIGGIFGYMKGRKDGEAVGPTAAAPPAGNQAGCVSVRLAVIMLLLCALLTACASSGSQQFTLNCGGTQTANPKATATDTTKMDGNSASAQLGYNKGPGSAGTSSILDKAADLITGK